MSLSWHLANIKRKPVYLVLFFSLSRRVTLHTRSRKINPVFTLPYSHMYVLQPPTITTVACATTPSECGNYTRGNGGSCVIIMEQTIVQRSYNAFAVRVQAERGRERRVVPASETDEGDLCIEMRIRLKSDGLMSNLLSQLIKVRTRRIINDCKRGSTMGREGMRRFCSRGGHQNSPFRG